MRFYFIIFLYYNLYEHLYFHTISIKYINKLKKKNVHTIILVLILSSNQEHLEEDITPWDFSYQLQNWKFFLYNAGLTWLGYSETIWKFLYLTSHEPCRRYLIIKKILSIIESVLLFSKLHIYYWITVDYKNIIIYRCIYNRD